MSEFDNNGFDPSGNGNNDNSGQNGNNSYNQNNGSQNPYGNGNNGQKPDYSYNWNGSEHKKIKKKKNYGRYIAVAVVCILVVGALVAVALAGSFGKADDPDPDPNGTNNSVPEVIVADKSEDTNSTNGENSNPSSDAVTGTNHLTEIYDRCSKSCCTVEVSYRNYGGAIGSGFVIEADKGYIATNHHVIEGASKVDVVFYDGKKYKAEIVGSDPVSDLAVLKVNAKDLVKIPLGSSKDIKVGQSVVAIGTPYSQELAGTMSYGIISGIARDIEIPNDMGVVVKTMTLLQTDCSINPGNSGGPLIDMNGQVVGINSMKIVANQFENIGFAIPITSAIDIFNQIIAGEDTNPDFATAAAILGITVSDVDAGFENLGIKPTCEYPKGALVVDLNVGTAIYRAGLERFDIITDFNGDKVNSHDELGELLKKHKAGEEVTVKVFRFNRTFSKGEEVTLKFKLDAAK